MRQESTSHDSSGNFRRALSPANPELAAVIVGSIAGTLLLLSALFALVRYWRSARKKWGEDERVQEKEHDQRLSEPTLTSATDQGERPDTVVDLRNEVDLPPRLQLSPGWPSEARTEKQSSYSLLPLGEYLDEGDLLSGRTSPSIAEAVAGSTSASAVPSRATTRHGKRNPEGSIAARRNAITIHQASAAESATFMSRRLSIISGWSRRAAIRSDGASEVESLPAYSLRRSRSLASLYNSAVPQSESSRYSRAQARRTSAIPPDGVISRASSVSHIPTVSPSTDLAEFPMELARKLLETYPRTPHAASPPEYTL